MKKTLILAGGAAVALVVGAAIAAPDSKGSRFDPNGDGKVTLSEMQQKTAERFKRMDANGDGAVTKEERSAMREQWSERRGERGGWRGGGHRGERFAKLDPDGDGSVTVAEMQKRAADRIVTLDTNKDGKITRDEFAAGRGSRGHHDDD